MSKDNHFSQKRSTSPAVRSLYELSLTEVGTKLSSLLKW